jgi:hypothetical protein
MSYKLVAEHPIFGTSNTVIRISDGASIPFDPANMDFVEYNKWLSEGNIPLPPDEPTLP